MTAVGKGSLLTRHSRIKYPAKFAYGLICRIVDHGLREGYWKRGDWVADCFAGVALGGIICGGRGLNWIGVELESEATGGSPFVELGNRNLEKHRATFEHEGVEVRLVQGDSRNFARLVASLNGIITSPPYAESITGAHGETETAAESREKRQTPGGSLGKSARHGGYGVTEGQIGALKEGSLDGAVTSPPYAEGKGHGGEPTPCPHDTRGTADAMQRAYGQTEGQIGSLKDAGLDACVTSPPYAQSVNQSEGANDAVARISRKSSAGVDVSVSSNIGGPNSVLNQAQTYGTTPGQIGQEKPDNYWRAMKTVYEQTYLALKPNGVLCVVCKDYVSKGKRVPLCDYTCLLLEVVGFHVFERTRAMLVKEDRHPGLFGEDVVKTKKRVSFFRRLAEKKGSPPIDYEEVIWTRKASP